MLQKAYPYEEGCNLSATYRDAVAGAPALSDKERMGGMSQALHAATQAVQRGIRLHPAAGRHAASATAPAPGRDTPGIHHDGTAFIHDARFKSERLFS